MDISGEDTGPLKQFKSQSSVHPGVQIYLLHCEFFINLHLQSECNLHLIYLDSSPNCNCVPGAF